MPVHRNARNIIGSAVARYRNAREWSQSDLATKCQIVGWDITRSIVASIEGQVRWVGDWEVMLLAKALKISVADLMAHGADPLSLLIKRVGPKRRSGKTRLIYTRRTRGKPNRVG